MCADGLAPFVERLRASPQANWILTGGINSGKSLFLQRMIETSHLEFPGWRVGGLVSRGLFFGGVKIAYQGIDCLSGATFLLAMRRVLSGQAHRFLEAEFQAAMDLSGGVEIGSWQLLENGLFQAVETIRQAVHLRSDLVVIDEFGPLECQGKGLRAAADAVVESGIPLLLVVREGLVEEVQYLYGTFEILSVPVGNSITP